jgi:poly-gamma-glutamate synthesis protein (capsule biosynthesis protein)
MALEPEELRRRQQERAVRRARRKARKRKMILYLAAAAVILLACGFLIIRVAQQGANRSTEPEETLPSTVIHLAAAGDLNVTDGVVSAGGPDHDYTEAFLDIAHLLADADLTAVNFEGNLIGAPYGSEKHSAPPQLLTALKNAGVDMVQIANSRTISNGVTGLVTTLQSIRASGLEPLGAYGSNQEYEKTGGYTVWEAKGVKVAVVAFTKGMDSMALPAGSEDCVNLLYEDYSSKYVKINRERITAVLEAAAAEKPDITIALLHWGSEYNDTHSKTQGDIANLMFSLGVDAIIGTHPHYVQEMQFNAEKGTFLAYSLGDLLGDGTKSGTEYSVVLELEITKNNTTGSTDRESNKTKSNNLKCIEV